MTVLIFLYNFSFFVLQYQVGRVGSFPLISVLPLFLNYQMILEKGIFVATRTGSVTEKYKIMREVVNVSYADRAGDLRNCVPGLRADQCEKFQGHQESLKEKYQ